MTPKGKFHSRSFISLVTGFSFVIMSLSGIVLYFVPQGRIAYWTNWRLVGLTKTDWGNIHIISSLLFILGASYHLVLNWRPFLAYLGGKVQAGRKYGRELVFALLVTAVFTVGSVALFPPFGQIVRCGDFLKSLWITSPDLEPPFGHAEQLSLRVFTRRMNIDLAVAVDELNKRGIKADAKGDASLEALAKGAGTSPMKIYGIVKGLPSPPPSAASPVPEQGTAASKKDPATQVPRRETFTEEMVLERFEGKGVGKKSLEDLCREVGFDLAKAMEKLKRRNWEISPRETLKDGAARYNVSPVEIVKALLIGEPIEPAKTRPAG